MCARRRRSHVTATPAVRGYTSAPIVEAVLDIQVEGVPQESASRLQSYRHPIYPVAESSMSTTAHVRTNPLGVDAQVHREIDGIRLTSAFRHQAVVQSTYWTEMAWEADDAELVVEVRPAVDVPAFTATDLRLAAEAIEFADSRRRTRTQ